MVKSESSVYSLDNLKSDKVTAWNGVRNYQARNYLKEMEVGDEVFFYHSVDEPVGIVGVAKVAKKAYPDPSQFDKNSEFFEAKCSKEEPRWFCPDLKFVKKFKKTIALADLKKQKGLQAMQLLQKGSRLSVQPVSSEERGIILKLAE